MIHVSQTTCIYMCLYCTINLNINADLSFRLRDLNLSLSLHLIQTLCAQAVLVLVRLCIFVGIPASSVIPMAQVRSLSKLVLVKKNISKY